MQSQAAGISYLYMETITHIVWLQEIVQPLLLGSLIDVKRGEILTAHIFCYVRAIQDHVCLCICMCMHVCVYVHMCVYGCARECSECGCLHAV